MSPLQSFKNQHPSDYLGMIAAIMAVGTLILSGYALRHTLSCFLLSYIIAYLLDPLIVKLEKRGFKRIHGLVFLYVILGIFSAFAVMFLLPMLTISWNSFLNNLPQHIQKIKGTLVYWQNNIPNHYGSAEISWLVNTVLGNIDSMAEKAGIWVYEFASKMFFNVFNLVLAPIIVFFMLNYKQKIMDTAEVWIPDTRRELILKMGREIDGSIGGYLRGQIMVSIMVAVATGSALLLLGIPHPFLCGVFAGVASILPFIGVIIAMIPPLLFAWLYYGTGAIIVKVLSAFAVIYFLEGYLAKPLVFKQSMNLNPLLTIIMVMAFGELMGFWGILLALPITAAFKIASQHWLKGDFANPGNKP